MAKDCTNVAITKAFLLGGCHPSAQTLGSRNFIKLVSIKVAVLRYNTMF
ncbi:hypothetical protein HCR18_06525 [Wolbachia pipientis]|nr:hypothetical protein [Wolbachia pipientis]MBA8758639.1 hypothetical protein [Wolbachia pipientis]MBA8770081.1 hypothetical protein [Wolbachia pipientis]